MQVLEAQGPGLYGQQSPAVTLQLLTGAAGFLMYKLAVVGVGAMPPPVRRPPPPTHPMESEQL